MKSITACYICRSGCFALRHLELRHFRVMIQDGEPSQRDECWLMWDLSFKQTPDEFGRKDPIAASFCYKLNWALILSDCSKRFAPTDFPMELLNRIFFLRFQGFFGFLELNIWIELFQPSLWVESLNWILQLDFPNWVICVFEP